MSVAALALGTALGSLAAQGISKIVEGITGFVSSGFAFNNTLEQATAKLIAFTGSGEAAAKVLEMVRKRAAATPFAFDEMANSAAGLAAVSKSTGADLEGLLGIAERLAASNPAEGLEGAAFALREAFSGDFISLQDRFNLSKDTIARIKEAGVSVETFDLILGELGITTQLVSGLAETFTGRLSTFQDTITGLAASLTLPIFDAFKTILMELQPILEKNSEAISKFLGEIGQGIGENILGAWGLLRDAVITFQDAVSGGWVDSDIVQPFHRLVGIIGTVVGQFGLIGDAFGRLMEGKPIDSYIEAIVRNISEMLGLDLTNLEFAAIVDDISLAIETAMEWVWRFQLGWALVEKAFGKVQELITSQWFNDNILSPLTAITDFIANEFLMTWGELVTAYQDAKTELDLLNKSSDSFKGLIGSINLFMSSLLDYYRLWGIFLGISTEKSKDNNKQLDEMVTIGGILDGIFRGLTGVVLGWTVIVQKATEALMSFVSWVKTAYDRFVELVGIVSGGINAGASAGAGIDTTPNTPVNTVPKGGGGQVTKAPATGLMSPVASSTTRNNNVVLNITVNGGGANTASQVKDSAIDALRSVGLA